MTHIEQMIKDMCPHGVEWKTFDELGVFYGGLSGKTKDDFKEGNAKFITYLNIANNPALRLDIEETVKIGPNEKQNIVQYGDALFTGSSETPNECAMSSVVTEHPEEKLYLNSFCFGFRFNSLEGICPAFYKHYFRSDHFRKVVRRTANGTTRFNVSKKEFEKLAIPIPPLEIQEKIVECLDKFSALAAELQAELQLRRKQYEYYRTQLLTPHSNCNSADKTDDCNWEWKTLGEIFELRGGYTPSKNNPNFWEGGSIPWFRMEDIRLNGRILEDSIQHITPAAIKGKGLFEKNTFILATTATIGEHALLIADSLANQRFTNLKIRKSLENSLLTKFVFHYMFIVDEYCKAHTNVSGFESVDMDALKKMPFPIPPLAEQKRIADLLDKFEALTTSLSDGIPAEQAAQQKRYEYYRDLLLTFPRKEV